MDERGSADTIDFVGVFARFRLSLNDRRLYRLDQARGKVPVRLGNASFELLRLLVDQEGNPISRKVLKSEAWPGRDEDSLDDNLRVEIQKLRSSLGENAQNSCIRSEPKGGGYRYIPPATPLPSGDDRGVELPTGAMARSEPVKVFISYAHKDEQLRDQLETQLAILQRQGLIKIWHDREIGAGAEWSGTIDSKLETADVILLLVSPDFLASDYISDVELQQAMERHEQGISRVIPIILRPCLWRRGPFAKLQALPTDGEPVTSAKWGSIDIPFHNIAEGIERAAKELLSKSSAKSVALNRSVATASSEIFYNLPSLPDHYQPREVEIAGVRAKLLRGSAVVGITSAARAIGLQGMGGIGKTVLATTLVHDPEIRAAFCDGIFWLTFGREVSVLVKAAELAYALTNERTNFATVSEARGQLGLYTADKRLLVVLDDVWEPTAVDPFTGLGAGCRLLITTRDTRALERARADKHQIELLDPDTARTFLSEATDIGVEALPTVADEIVRECGRLPLALAAVGAMIRRRTFNWSDALKALHDKRLKHLDSSWLPDPEQRSLAVVLKLSVDALSDNLRACFLDCACFREDVDIPEATLFLLWSDRQSDELRRKILAQELVDRSLVRRDEQGRYRIHDLYMDYLRHAAAPLTDRHRHLIERYRSICPDGWVNCPDDGYCVQHIAWHLYKVGEFAEVRRLVRSAAWVERKSAGLDILTDFVFAYPEPGDISIKFKIDEIPLFFKALKALDAAAIRGAGGQGGKPPDEPGWGQDIVIHWSGPCVIIRCGRWESILAKAMVLGRRGDK
jgi:DNA-binding winged helix-turn-helix (wHTH) protein